MASVVWDSPILSERWSLYGDYNRFEALNAFSIAGEWHLSRKTAQPFRLNRLHIFQAIFVVLQLQCMHEAFVPIFRPVIVALCVLHVCQVLYLLPQNFERGNGPQVITSHVDWYLSRAWVFFGGGLLRRLAALLLGVEAERGECGMAVEQVAQSIGIT